jgi:hypothetical protein
MRTAFLAMSLALGALAFGCGSSDSRNYTFSENGCSTQTHTFDSQAAYCQGLQSESLNNFCAQDMRKAAYLRDCGAAFTPTS